MSEFTFVINRRAQKNRSRRTQKPNQSTRKIVPTRSDFRSNFPIHHDIVDQYGGKAVQVQGAWRTSMKVNTAQVVDIPKRRQQQKVRPSSNKNGIECAYCHDHGHHIRNCQKATDATARKQKSCAAVKQKQAEDKLNRAEERLRQKVIAAQQALQLSQQPVVVEEENNDSDTDSDCEGIDSHVKIAHIETLIASKELEFKTTKSWADRSDLSEEIEELNEELAELRR